MSRLLLDYDPVTKTSEWFDYDEGTDSFSIATEQDLQDTLDYNKELRNEPGHFRGANNEMWHAASIPNIIILKWLNEDGIDVFNKEHWPQVKRKLNDPDYRHLRTGEFKV